MIKTYKYRLFTNANQERELGIALETHRRLYNQLLDGSNLCWETAGVRWTWVEQSRWFTVQKKTNRFYAALNRASVTYTIKRLERSFIEFFRRIQQDSRYMPPRFKGKEDFNSFSYDMRGNGGGCKVVNNRLRLHGIGSVRIKWHRPIIGTVIQGTVVRERGKWYVCFSVFISEAKLNTDVCSVIGIDVGLNSFATTSERESLGDSRILEKNLKKIRVRHRKLSRAKRGSNTRKKKKTKKQFTNLHAKIRNTRRDMHHKVARSLVDKYRFIAAECLNIQGMVKNRRLARRIYDAGWGGFLEIVKQKCEEMGGRLVLVDPRNTSQLCSSCGETVKKKLSVRTHKCDCGLILDRDVNAARNILARALPEFAKLGSSLV